ncbi:MULTISPECIES: hypothetical protein [Halorussus]|uniref:hypothetical protein n=1 Tax=Halorussus TaxID=1070314 RepID=UPI0020A1D303|nr:hypothetical protein [Halorussus vallis]USZ74430.1 hypothetical protein NGM07_13355 [Halorussus vallis]
MGSSQRDGPSGTSTTSGEDPDPSKADRSEASLIEWIRGGRFVRWMLLRGNRFAVSGVILAGMVVALTVSLVVLEPNLNAKRMRWLFNGLVNGLLSLVTIVLTINQLMLSRQFGSPDDLYDRLNERIEFRERIEDTTDSVISPSQPAGFTRVLFRALHGRAAELGEEATPDDDRLRNEIADYVATVRDQTNDVADDLEAQPFEMDGLLTILNYDDSWQFYTTRRFQTIYGDQFSDRANELLEEMRELLKQIDTARQYFKTLYLQRELAQLSRRIVYVGSVAIVTASVVLLAYKNAWALTVSFLPSVVAISLLTAVTLSPVAVLFSYALRLATVSRRTVVFGPFTPEEEQRADTDWST